RLLPPAGEKIEVTLTSNKMGGGSGALAAANAADAQNPIQCDWSRYAFELMRTLLFDNEQPGHLTLDGGSNQHCPRLSSRMKATRHIGRLAEHLAGRVNNDRAIFKAHARSECRRGLSVAHINVSDRTLDS